MIEELNASELLPPGVRVEPLIERGGQQQDGLPDDFAEMFEASPGELVLRVFGGDLVGVNSSAVALRPSTARTVNAWSSCTFG